MASETDETETIRVTFPGEALEAMRELNPVALNEPELTRFYAGLGLIAAKQQARGDIEVPTPEDAPLADADDE